MDKDAEALFPHWKERGEEWKKTGSDRPYPYFGSGIWYGRIGKAAGKTMLELAASKPATPVLHTFRSADGSKTFQAELLEYNPATEQVSVRETNGRVMRFKIGILSEDNQKHVRQRSEK